MPGAAVICHCSVALESMELAVLPKSWLAVVQELPALLYAYRHRLQAKLVKVDLCLCRQEKRFLGPPEKFLSRLERGPLLMVAISFFSLVQETREVEAL
jgi:hypothetical protein